MWPPRATTRIRSSTASAVVQGLFWNVPEEGACAWSAIVIVHGAFGGGWEWREVAALLRARGHDVYTPTLTGFGERVHLATAETSLETHIQDITNLLRYEDLYRVTLACQSYGGMIATGVADRVPERLTHLVYLDALVPEDGQPGHPPHPAFVLAALRGDGPDKGRWMARIPVPAFEDDPRVASFARGRDVPTPVRPFTEPIRLGPIADSVPAHLHLVHRGPGGLERDS